MGVQQIRMMLNGWCSHDDDRGRSVLLHTTLAKITSSFTEAEFVLMADAGKAALYTLDFRGIGSYTKRLYIHLCGQPWCNTHGQHTNTNP